MARSPMEKFFNDLAKLLGELLLSYYRPSTFLLLNGINKRAMLEIGVSVFKYYTHSKVKIKGTHLWTHIQKPSLLTRYPSY